MPSRIPRVNLLLVGPDTAVEHVLDAVSTPSQVARETDTWRPGKPFVLPDAVSTTTLILRDVDTLVQDDQRRLLEWMEKAAGRAQVISTASAPLLPDVEAGAFMQTLDHRLNTIYLDLTDGRTDGWDW